MCKGTTIAFRLGDMWFEYDEEKNRGNIKKHGISLRSAARVFFDYDRIEMFDDDAEYGEDRYDTIGDTSAGYNFHNADPLSTLTIGSAQNEINEVNDILFVVYTERFQRIDAGKKIDITRLISARLATNFERGLYYGKHE